MASLIETPRSYQRRSEFYHQLSMLQQAGVGIRDSLHQINPHSRQEAEEIRGTLDQMGSGATFSESLSGRTRWLPDFDRLMIEAGETSGQLDQTLRILSEHYEHRSSLIRQVLLKLAYPVLLIHFIILMPALSALARRWLAVALRYSARSHHRSPRWLPATHSCLRSYTLAKPTGATPCAHSSRKSGTRFRGSATRSRRSSWLDWPSLCTPCSTPE